MDDGHTYIMIDKYSCTFILDLTDYVQGIKSNLLLLFRLL